MRSLIYCSFKSVIINGCSCWNWNNKWQEFVCIINQKILIQHGTLLRYYKTASNDFFFKHILNLQTKVAFLCPHTFFLLYFSMNILRTIAPRVRTQLETFSWNRKCPRWKREKWNISVADVAFVFKRNSSSIVNFCEVEEDKEWEWHIKREKFLCCQVVSFLFCVLVITF